jgi:hypothetical protein
VSAKAALLLAVIPVVSPFVTWSLCAYSDARKRQKSDERYISWRERGEGDQLIHRVFDWFNETADKLVAKRGF